MTAFTMKAPPAALYCLVLAAFPVRAEMIHLYARKGEATKVMAEIAKGVPVNLPSTRNTTETGVSPLFIAAKFGQTETVRALIRAGAEIDTFFDHPDAPYPYGTPLHVAAYWGRAEVVGLLLEAGAAPDQYDIRVGTPLQMALENGHTEIGDMLIAAGALTRVEQPSINGMIASADLALGNEIARGCEYCHHMEQGSADSEHAGPPLWGIVGRPKGAVEGYEYSNSMAQESDAWSYEALNSFLAAPYRYLPGTRMTVRGIESDSRRAALIAYLRTLSETPVPLP